MNSQLSRQIFVFGLRASLAGEVITPEDQHYLDAIKLWNAAVHIRPAVIAVCKHARDVITALSLARGSDWKLRVRGGGHDWSGLALCDDALVIDLSRMRSVVIDAAKKEAVLEGGATAGDLLTAADRYDLVAVTGAGSSIGMAGLTMGGGYGPLTPLYGLALDNLISAVLVMADGSMLTASENENPDLFWAIRGGGGNFGVVVSMRMRLYDAQPILSAQFLYPWSAAAQIMSFVDDFAKTAPDSLSLMTGLVPGADGKQAVLAALTWCGDVETGEVWISAFRGLRKPMNAKVQQLRCQDLLAEFDAFVTQGNYNHMKTRWLGSLEPGSLEIIIKAGTNVTSSLSTIILQYVYGKPVRLPEDSTAFGIRQPHILALFTSTWTSKDDVFAEKHRAWTKELCGSLGDYALPGGYPNVLTEEDVEQVAHAYGQNIEHLKRLKSYYDPDGVFCSFPIPS